jgi:hypothetical protein
MGRVEAVDPQGPDAHALDETFSAHARGATPVAAVFRAFLIIYYAWTANLFRITFSALVFEVVRNR